jgi:hypothetical protein
MAELRHNLRTTVDKGPSVSVQYTGSEARISRILLAVDPLLNICPSQLAFSRASAAVGVVYGDRPDRDPGVPSAASPDPDSVRIYARWAIT